MYYFCYDSFGLEVGDLYNFNKYIVYFRQGWVGGEMPTKGEIQWIDGVYETDPLWARKQPDPVSMNFLKHFSMVYYFGIKVAHDSEAFAEVLITPNVESKIIEMNILIFI